MASRIDRYTATAFRIGQKVTVKDSGEAGTIHAPSVAYPGELVVTLDKADGLRTLTFSPDQLVALDSSGAAYLQGSGVTEVKDATGATVLARGRGLRPIRRRASAVGCASVDLYRTITGGAEVRFTFRDGSTAYVPFASYDVACGVLRRWRSIHGAELYGRTGNDHRTLVGYVAPGNRYLVECKPTQFQPWYPTLHLP